MMPSTSAKRKGPWAAARSLLTTPMRWLSRIPEEPVDAPDLRLSSTRESEATRAGLASKRAGDLMRARTEIAALPVTATVEEIRAFMREERYSRYPVYRESLDDVVGVLVAKDFWLYDGREEFDLASQIRPVPYVPATRPAERVLEDLRRSRAHLAVVLDEFGGTAGILTLEDLIEEIIGDISDEYDFALRQSVESNGILELDGTMSLADARAEFGLDIPKGDWNTIGGFVFGELGRLARMGDRVSMVTGELEVVAMDGRRVAAVRVVAPKPPPSP
jgi:putative hemolysin